VDDRYYLVDLPGYGYARASHTERSRLLHLLEGYLSERRSLHGVVWLLDARRDPSADDLAMAEWLLTRRVPVLAAVTKVDKVGTGQRAQRRRAILDAVGLPEDQCVETSARARAGIDDLRASIDALVAG
jgi:GTP-binding protein